MAQIDWSTLAGWIVTGLIGLLFGMVGAWVTHRFDRKRDDIAWAREKTRLEEQWRHDRELLELQFQQKLDEIKREDHNQLVNNLLRGVDNPKAAIRAIESEELRRQQEIEMARSKSTEETPEIAAQIYVSTLYMAALEELKNKLTKHAETQQMAEELRLGLQGLAMIKDARRQAEVEPAEIESNRPLPAIDPNAPPDKMNCSNCGTVLKPRARFCPNCGRPTT